MDWASLTDDSIFDMFDRRCISCFANPAVCLHHIYGRSSPVRIPSCQSCHDWATDHAREARLVLPRRLEFAMRLFDYA